MDTRTTRAAEALDVKRRLQVPSPVAPPLFKRLIDRALGVLRAPEPPQAKTRFESFEPRVLLAADPVVPRIDGSLDVAGETDRYVFNVTENIRVVFDALTNNGNLNWSLTGPRGTVVSSRAFTSSDSADIGGDVAYELTEGEYILSVDGVGDTTGAYAFRLIDINKAKDLTVGAITSGTMSPANQTDAFKFSVVAGQTFFFDRLSSSNQIYWRLIDPYGRTVTGPTNFSSDLGAITLGLDGSYTLLIEGYRSNTGTASYSFRVSLLDDPVPQALTLGSLVQGAIEAAGTRDVYTFTLDAPRLLLFDSLTNDSGLRWSLISATAGTLISNRTLQSSDSYDIGNTPVLNLGAGTYTVALSGSGDRVGGYSFRLLDLSAASAYTPGTVFSGVTEDAGTFAAGSRVDSSVPLDAPLDPGTAYLGRNSATYVEVADRPELRPGAITVEAWVYKDPAMTSWGGVLMKSSSSGWNDGYGLAHYASDGKIHFFVNDYAAGDVSATLPANEWTHVAGTFDGTQVKLYINGVLAATRSLSATVNHSNSPRFRLVQRQTDATSVASLAHHSPPFFMVSALSFCRD